MRAGSAKMPCSARAPVMSRVRAQAPGGLGKVQRMARFARCMVLALSLVVLGGCASWVPWRAGDMGSFYPHARSETLGQSGEDHEHAIRSMSAHDKRALVEDLDLLFQTERPTRLSRWHGR